MCMMGAVQCALYNYCCVALAWSVDITCELQQLLTLVCDAMMIVKVFLPYLAKQVLKTHQKSALDWIACAWWLLDLWA